MVLPKCVVALPNLHRFSEQMNKWITNCWWNNWKLNIYDAKIVIILVLQFWRGALPMRDQWKSSTLLDKHRLVHMHHKISTKALMFEHGPTKGSKVIYEFTNIHIEKFWGDWIMLVLSTQKWRVFTKATNYSHLCLNSKEQSKR